MRVVLLDDEFYTLEGLRMDLEEIGDIVIAGAYTNGRRMLDELPVTRPDVLFLDVEMPGLNGFQVLDAMNGTGWCPRVVFTTAFSQYAVQAFEVNAVDYLVKPVSKERLEKTLGRLREAAADRPAEMNPRTVEPESAEVGVSPEESGHEDQDRQRISICCFGAFEVKVDGQIVNTGWRTKKAEELLAHLVCGKGRFVSKERIAEDLWPEASAEQGLNSLYTAHYYLRQQEKRLGVVFPIESARGRMRICLDNIDCDILRMESKMADLVGLTGEQRIHAMEELIACCRGLLLEQSYYEWAMPMQREYAYRREEIIRELAAWHRQAGNQAKAQYYRTLHV